MTGSPTLPPPGWHPDPSGRHELRYWDGTRWSEHVSDAGQVSTDDLAAPAPPTAPEATAVAPEPLADAAPDATAAAAGADTPLAEDGSADAAAATATTTAAALTALAAPPPSVPASGGGFVGPGGPVGAPAGWGAPPAMMRSIGGLASSLTVVLWITVAVSVFEAVAFVNRITVINDLLDFRGGFSGYYDLVQRGQDADDLVSVASGLGALCSLVILVLLIIWMWRVAKNALDAGRTNPRFAPGWTIGGWFIPVANLVIPGLILQDLWRGSDPSIERGDPMWRLRATGSALVGWWWAMWVLGVFTTVRIIGDGNDRDYFERLRLWDSVSAGGQLVRIAAAILLMLVVRRITRRQEALFAGRPVVT